MADLMKKELYEIDPLIHKLTKIEEERQSRKIILIASESMAPKAVRDALSGVFQNLYAEGYPSTRMCMAPLKRLEDFSEYMSFYRRYGSRRYYKGVEYADFVEAVARRRAAQLFANERVPEERIYANVQSLSGAAANNAVYEAFLNIGDCVMGMDLTHGGHLTHGHQVNRSGRHFNIIHYRVGRDGKLDYEAMKKLSSQIKPKLIIAGFSAYPWDIDWSKMREVADSAGEQPAILLADIAHTAGLVAAGLVNSPIGYADVVTMTTHKTLCGPRGAIILTTNKSYADKIDSAVFPGEQGGPHIHQIAAKAVAFGIAKTEEFRSLMKGVIDNAKALAEALKEEGFELAYGGTNTHMVLIDLRKISTSGGDHLSGEIASRILDLCNITCNKNTIWGDTSAFEPGAIRFGTTWVTQRDFKPEHMKKIAQIVSKVLHSASSFRYIGAFGDIIRARFNDLSVLNEARREVEKLIESVEGKEIKKAWCLDYPHIYGSTEEETIKGNAVEVFGERAHLFLEHILSAGVQFMRVGQIKSSYVFGAGGEVISKVILTRMGDDDFGRRHFLLKPYEGKIADLVRWLRGVSDGYIIAEKDDLYLKPYGPVCVEVREESYEISQPDSHLEIDMDKPFYIGRKVIAKRIAEFPEMLNAEIIKSRKTKKEFEFVWKPEGGSEAKETCLFKEHLKRVEKKRIVEFAGWKLPIWFSSIADEHRAVRTTAGLFDVSHMGVLEFSGEGAEAFLDLTTTAFLPSMIPGQARYSYLLAPDGRVIDDIMIYKISATKFIVVVNAANADEDEAWWRAVASGDYILDFDNREIMSPFDVTIRNLKDPSSGSDRKVDIALQGPLSLMVLKKVIKNQSHFEKISELRRFEFTEVQILGSRVIVARTGYTGEKVGFELLIHPDEVAEIWNAILDAGMPIGVLPAGLGARDSTRTEAGLPLHGHELAGTYSVNPIEAGYGSFVKLHKPFFVGRKAMLKAAKERTRQIVRFKVTGKGPRMVRNGHIVVDGRKGKFIGMVTSCTLVGNTEIGMAIVDSAYAHQGTPLGICTYTDKDGIPSAKKFSELNSNDWIPLTKPAVVLSRFPDPNNPFDPEMYSKEGGEE